MPTSAAFVQIEQLEDRTLLAVVSIVATDPDASEVGPDSGQFTVSLDSSLSENLTVYYDISGTATNGTDYMTLSGSVEITMGMTSATINVDPWPDSEAEGAETVTLTLTSGDYTIGSSSFDTVTIADTPLPDATAGKLDALAEFRYGNHR